ncbi:cache and HAMP domain-containing protein [Desulfopila sp. IMCC35008]|uniref:HAMP domain-containing protein n=1 Tax=Desulfopila sp. IMCC35008 TaxID=2653858 RepID=UPI0013D71DFD|nr:cache and HAMP domain-containing protein [Desulfopila sp. IMCC35008]
MADKAGKDDGTKGFTILYQILFGMLIISIIPLGGLWYISIEKARVDWEESIYNSMVRDTQSLAGKVDDWTSMNLRLLKQNAQLPGMQSMSSDSQNPILKAVANTYEWVYLAFTVRPDGENVGRSDGKPLTYYGDRQYFKQVMGGRDIGQQLLMGKTSGKPAYILSHPVHSSSNKLGGVLAIAMTLEELSATITKTKIGSTGFAILVDDQNRLVAHGEGKVANELQDMSEHPVLKFRDKIVPSNFIFENEGRPIIGYKYKTLLGWTMIVQQDVSEAFKAADRARQYALTLLGLTLVVVLVVGYILANRLSKPIRNLTAIADSISKGELGAEINETSRGDEIGALARAIERMGVSLQMAFDRLRKRRA